MARPAEWVAPGQRGPKIRSLDDCVGKLLSFPGGVVVAIYDTSQSGAFGVVVRGNDRHPVGGNNLYVLAADVESVPELPAPELDG